MQKGWKNFFPSFHFTCLSAPADLKGFSLIFNYRDPEFKMQMHKVPVL